MRMRLKEKLQVLLDLAVASGLGSFTDEECERLEKHLDAFADENYKESNWKNE